MAENIAEEFVKTAEKYPDRLGVIEARTGKSIRFKELNNRSNAFATYFRKNGVLAGDTVMLMVTPSIDFICLALAFFKSGTPVILIDPGMGYKNLLRCIESVKPDILVAIPRAILFTKVFPGSFSTIKRKFCCGNSFGILGPDLTKNIPVECDEFPVYSPEHDDLAAIIFTTGSTGPPKGVEYEHSIFSAQLKLIKDYYRIGPDDIDQPAFPLFALFSAALGACSVIPDMDATKPAQVNPQKFIGSIKKYGVTYSFGSPAIWNVVSSYCKKENIVLESVKKVLMAGAPVPYNLMKRVIGVLPSSSSVYTPYGATESLPIVSIEGQEVISDTWERTRIGGGTCVGKPLPGIEIKIISISDKPIGKFLNADVLAKEQIGEIIVKGSVVTRGYLNNPEETQLAKIQDGGCFWHRMGDVGYLDEDGRLWFCGRKAHRVETVDMTLYTIPCEAIINEHPGVYRSALVGIDRIGGGKGKLPVMIVEPYSDRKIVPQDLIDEIKILGTQSSLTSSINDYMIHPSFPVDIRHNAKIFREKLAIWAQKQI